ncbi:MAG: bacterial Ig-like domain-containing protein [Treponema sp.]|nr:bacterial Ig-like domain-containing protein [Treponema sp.]
MKKFNLCVLALASFVLFSCNHAGEGPEKKQEPQKQTLTTRINETNADVDFKNEVIAEDAAVNKAKTVSNLKMDGKTLTVNVSGVTLKNISDAAIEAGKGIGNGDLNIDGCSVDTLTVLGGGSNSINISNTKIEEISVEKKAVRLNLQQDSEIQNIVVAVNDIKIEAAETVTIKTVAVEEAVELVTLSGGKIESLSLDGETETLPTIFIKGKTTISAIETKDEAAEVKVTIAEEIKDKVSIPEEIIPVIVTLENKYIVASNAKKLYKKGESFDYTNIIYIEEYSDGTVTQKTLSDAVCTTTGFDSSKDGECTVTIKYGDVETKITVKIYADDDPIVTDTTKNLDLEAALIKGIEKVSKDGFISSEEDFLKVIMEAAAEYQEAFFASGDNASVRSIVDIPANKDTNVMAAIDSIMSFANEVVSIYNDIMKSGGKIDVDFDQTINLGELTVSQWFDVVLQVAYAIINNDQNQNSVYMEKGPVPEEADGWFSNWIYEKDNETVKYYWEKEVYGDTIDISNMPKDYYVDTWYEYTDYIAYINAITGERTPIYQLPEDCYLNGTNIYKRVYLDSGYTFPIGKVIVTWDKSEGKYLLQDAETNEIICFAPDGYDSYGTQDIILPNETQLKYFWVKTELVDTLDISDMPEDCFINIITTPTTVYGYCPRYTGERIKVGELEDGYDSFRTNKNTVQFYKRERIGEIDISGWTGPSQPNVVIAYNENGERIYYLYSDSISLELQTKIVKNNIKHYTGKDFDEFTSFLDTVITIKNFYLNAKGDVSFNLEKLMDEKTNPAENIGSVSLATALNFGLADVNKAINPTDDSFDLPVKALAVNLEAKADASLSYGDLAKCFAVNENNSSFSIFNLGKESSSLDVATALELKLAVCTKEGNGGIITVSLDAATDLALLLDTVTSVIPGNGNENEGTATNAPLDLNDQIKKIGSLKVSVSDGKKVTWDKEYTYKDIMEIIGSFMN